MSTALIRVPDEHSGRIVDASGNEYHFERNSAVQMAKTVLGLGSAKARFEDSEVETDLSSETPIERLRYFCSLAMVDQDWLDVEPFFDAIVAERADAT